MPSPRVTVYITNYNYGRFLRQSIESVLRQTMDDWELVIIDDGSTDDSRSIIEEYAAHPRVTPIFQRNKGLNVSNNIALRAARGRYLMRLDADDYLDEHALGLLGGALDRDPELGLVFPDYYLVDSQGNLLELVRRHDFTDVTLLDQPAHGACTMFRKESLEMLSGYDETFRCQDGYDIWLRFIQRFKVQNINLPLFYYRQHDSSLTRNEEKILSTRSCILSKHAAAHGSALQALALVPTRGPTVDPDSMALRPLAGKPLLEWTIDAALAARRVAAVAVTTPDAQIIEHVRRRYQDRVLTVRRDRSLAAMNTFIEDTLAHALESLAPAMPLPSAVFLLYPEAPFRSAAVLDSAIDVMDIFDTDVVVGVRPENKVIYRHDGCGLQRVRETAGLRLEREELFRDVGKMTLVRREFFEQQRLTFGGRVGHVVLDRAAAINIESPWDWNLAEMLAERQAVPSSEPQG